MAYKPSSFIVRELADIVKQYQHDPLKLCLEVDQVLMTGLIEELHENSLHLKYDDKLQLICDLNYCAAFIDQLFIMVKEATRDPYYFLVAMLEEGEPLV